MNWKIGILVLGILAVVLVSGCTQPIENKDVEIKDTKDIEIIDNGTGLDKVVAANNQFALDLYSKYNSKETDEPNIFFSPYSISTALAMTYEGAKGQTAEEIQSVFHFPEDSNERKAGYLNLYNEINKPDKKYKLNTANALWAQQDYEFLPEYFNLVEKYYAGKVTNLNFREDTEGSRITINNWVEEQTNNKIKDLIPKGMITSLTNLVLTNAVYFKGEWAKQFNEDNTRDKYFKINANDSVEVPMMQYGGKEAIFNYAENDILQILELPYSGEELSMLIFLPKNNDMGTLENSLSVDELSKWKNDLKEQRIDIFIPKFKFETKYFMAANLKEMGMPTAFTLPGADFSGMDGTKNLYIGEVIHQAFVEVNEEGTEAAAATAVVMEVGAAPGWEPPKIPVFYADHPFIFIIQQKESGTILFMGKVVNPS